MQVEGIHSRDTRDSNVHPIERVDAPFATGVSAHRCTAALDADGVVTVHLFAMPRHTLMVALEDRLGESDALRRGVCDHAWIEFDGVRTPIIDATGARCVELPPPANAALGTIGVGSCPLIEISYDPEHGFGRVTRLDQLASFDLRHARREHDYLERRERCEIPPQRLYQPISDLHTHFAAAISAPALLEIAVASNTPFPVVELKRAGIEPPADLVVNYDDDEYVGVADLVRLMGTDASQRLQSLWYIPSSETVEFSRLEEIYTLRRYVVKDSMNFTHVLGKMAEESQSRGLRYIELSLKDILKPRWIEQAHEALPAIEAHTGVAIRFLAALSRHNPEEYNHEMIDRVLFLAERSPYVVGVDFMGEETNSAEHFSAQIRRLREYRERRDPDFEIRVHAGESPLFPSNIRICIEAGATRIGHGIYGCDPETMKLARDRGVIVEFNITSNSMLGYIGECLTELPVSSYRDAGVRITIGTDGSGIFEGAGGRAESSLAARAGLSREDLLAVARSDLGYIRSKERAFALRSAAPLLLPPDHEYPPARLLSMSESDQERRGLIRALIASKAKRQRESK